MEILSSLETGINWIIILAIVFSLGWVLASIYYSAKRRRKRIEGEVDSDFHEYGDSQYGNSR